LLCFSFNIEIQTYPSLYDQNILISNHVKQDAEMLPDGVTGAKLYKPSASLSFHSAESARQFSFTHHRVWAKTLSCEVKDLLLCHLYHMALFLTFKILTAKCRDDSKKLVPYLRAIVNDGWATTNYN